MQNASYHADCCLAWVGCSSLSVCLSVCPEHNSKTNDPKVFETLKLIQGMTLGYPRNDMVLGFKGHTHSLGLRLQLWLGLRQQQWRWFEFYECLLAYIFKAHVTKHMHFCTAFIQMSA